MLASKTTTAPQYLFYALKPVNGISKPGLKRIANGGHAIEVEVWEMPQPAVASFLKTIPSPLGIGSVELVDGTWKLGFICEPYGLQDALDISSFGGWRAYMATKQKSPKPIINGSSPRSIKSVLIANRGEIAVRIARTLRDMNIRSLAIYSSVDSDSDHVKSANEAFLLTGSTVSQTYLDGTQILKLATAAGADAIIPGYGFLAENADFAGKVEEAGLIWIGPTPEQMRELGLKHRARDIAVAAGVPVVPGSGRLLSAASEAVSEAKKIGYPVMLKSTAGGGGIGLRVCTNAQAVSEAFEAVIRLAEANFGDGRVFLERYIPRARHIEVQILGDGAGSIISAGDRDCSLQRRNQKVIEEAPALFVPEVVRTRMSKAAIDLAASVKYRNVGTVEFIYDVDKQEFYFLEVNTRLQVEHPVTESITGLDLVKCMMNIASNDCETLFSEGPRQVASKSAIETIGSQYTIYSTAANTYYWRGD
ncbi:putative urea amidolyase protein [Phaeoacremonium minimum UCRPA7]|uniref:Putative urea amidolyase protein n=1 Tax=Phaeoacremonium minimum (strain UCR-PA7) TaxID=1286976 RepID=R8BNG3_PHAM7|nr:putative urea amidolyase protein [Phaeoacremonium minimum UCRPA7]EOO00943.1 putative urea amidolyase protein [Phaeoacremonium minimum UCRPA7]